MRTLKHDDRFVVRIHPYRIENQKVFYNFQEAKDFYYQIDKKGKRVQLLYQFITPQGQYEEQLWKDNHNPLEGSFKFDAENFGGDPDGKLAKALERAREKAKEPRKPLKIERLKAESHQDLLREMEILLDDDAFVEHSFPLMIQTQEKRLSTDEKAERIYNLLAWHGNEDAYMNWVRANVISTWQKAEYGKIVGSHGERCWECGGVTPTLEGGPYDASILCDCESFNAENRPPSYMADSDAHKLMEASWRINSFVESGEEYPEWWKSRLSVAASNVDDLADYLDYAMSDDYDAESFGAEGKEYVVGGLEDQIDMNGDDLKVKIEASPYGIGIGAENLGTSTEGEGLDATPIWIENQEGDLIVHLWSDINHEDYTHRINMKDAMASKWEGGLNAESFHAQGYYQVYLYYGGEYPNEIRNARTFAEAQSIENTSGAEFSEIVNPQGNVVDSQTGEEYPSPAFCAEFNAYHDGVRKSTFEVGEIHPYSSKDEWQRTQGVLKIIKRSPTWLWFHQTQLLGHDGRQDKGVIRRKIKKTPQGHEYCEVFKEMRPLDPLKVKSQEKATEFNAKERSIAKKSWDTLNNVETAVGTVGLAHMIGLGAIFGGGLAFLKGRKSNSKTEK
jgi:hypothetical protein